MTKTKNSGKKTVLRRIIGIVGYILIFLIVALFIFVISFKTNNRTLFIFGKAAVWVMTPSMEPVIPERSYILVEKASADDIQVGDVIMFRSDDPSLNGANNTHRVVEISEDRKSFTTKGDANIAVDAEPAKAENIVGKYEKNLPVLSAIGRFLFSGIGTVITMTLIFVIIMIIYVPDVIRATREKTKELDKKRQSQIEDLVRAEVERLKRENGTAAAETEDKEEPDASAQKETETAGNIEEPDASVQEETETAENNEEPGAADTEPEISPDNNEETNASAQNSDAKEVE